MGQRYPTDLTEAEWTLLAPLIPMAKSGGRPRTTDMCSGSRTSAAVLTNIALSQLTLIENIAGVLLTLGNNVLRLW